MPKKKTSLAPPFKCPHCHQSIPRKAIATYIASQGAGNPNFKPVIRPCKKCGESFGARDMRIHIPVCPKK